MPRSITWRAPGAALAIAVLVGTVLLLATAGTASAQAPPSDRCTIDQDPASGCLNTTGEGTTDTFIANEGSVGPFLVTQCPIEVKHANPPADDRSGRVQFRLRNIECRNPINPASPLTATNSQFANNMFTVELHTTLFKVATRSGEVNQAVHTASARCSEAPAPHGTGGTCGGRLDAAADIQGLDAGDYRLESTVRLVLDEPGHPDPWNAPPPGWVEPTDTATPPQPKHQGICAAGETVIRCSQVQTFAVINDNQTNCGKGASNCTPAVREVGCQLVWGNTNCDHGLTAQRTATRTEG